MKTDLIHSLTDSFEAHAQETDNGVEFWLARDIQYLLGYTKWDNFLNAVFKAKIACETSGHPVPDHFADVGKTIAMPKGAEKEVPDIMLTRYACYLIVHKSAASLLLRYADRHDKAYDWAAQDVRIVTI